MWWRVFNKIPHSGILSSYIVLFREYGNPYDRRKLCSSWPWVTFSHQALVDQVFLCVGRSGAQCWVSANRLKSELCQGTQGPALREHRCEFRLQVLCPPWSKDFWLRISAVGPTVSSFVFLKDVNIEKIFIAFKNQSKSIQSSIN